MKNLKLVLVLFMFLGSITLTQAQRKVVKIYPKHGTVVTKVYKPKIVIHKGVNFHFSEGVWYKTRGKKFVVCAAPVGITVKRLPRGYKVVRVNGRKMYKYKGIWYKKKGRAYIVVNV